MPTIYRRASRKMVGTLRFAHPTKLRTDLPGAQLQVASRDQLAQRANHFGFSEIVSSPGIKNIVLSFAPKSVAQLRSSHGR